jgi:uncharacterized protein (TIGR02118 family)
MGLLKKKDEWSKYEFRKYWLENHAKVVLSTDLPGLVGYRQNHVLDSEQRGIEYARGPLQFDGFSQLWFADDAVIPAGFANDRLVADENHFMGTLHIVTAQSNTVVPPPQDEGTGIKRMSLLKRLPGMSVEEFRHEWFVRHAELVPTMPGVRGYRQNLIVRRELVKGQECAYEDLPIDGIVELWFDNTESLDAAFSSPEGKTTMAHAKTFISEITTFLVQEHRII